MKILSHNYLLPTKQGGKLYVMAHHPAEAASLLPAVIYLQGFGKYTELLSLKQLAKLGFATFGFHVAGAHPSAKSNLAMGEVLSPLSWLADLSAVVHHVAEQVNIDPERINLLGASLGGYVATLAATESDLPPINSLALIAPAYLLAHWRHFVSRANLQPGAITPADTQLCIYSPERTQNQMQAYLTEPKVCHLAKHFSMDEVPLTDRFFLDFDHIELEDALQHCSVPTLIIHGEADNVAPIYFSEHAVRIMPNAHLVSVPGAGHVPTSGREGEFTRLIATHFSKK